MSDSRASAAGRAWDRALREGLDRRSAEGALRGLRLPTGLVDFSSNDYLGLARSGEQARRLAARLADAGRTGAGGSRLLTGHHPDVEALEARAAAFHGSEAALFFASGYHANAAVVASLAGRGDFVAFDRLVHASLHEGMRLCRAECRGFAHNDPDALEDLLAAAPAGSRRLVLVESVYSMDGDLAPLAELAAVAERHGAALVVDEAHGAGLLGPAGAGLVPALGLGEAVWARVVTYGKAFGAAGACVLGSAALRDWLVNHARAFIYSTGPLAAQVAAVALAYDAVALADDARARVAALRERLLAGLAGTPWAPPEPERLAAAVVPLVLPAAAGEGDAARNRAIVALAGRLAGAGLDLRPIRRPTVPPGGERLRCCLHAHNTGAEVDALLAALRAEAG